MSPSYICNPKVATLNQIWDPNAVRYDPDTGVPTTGNWRALATADVNGSGTFNSFFAIVTGGAVEIPAGVKTWSIGVISGDVYLNGVGPLGAQITINGGGYNGHAISNAPILVSGTIGSHTLLLWET